MWDMLCPIWAGSPLVHLCWNDCTGEWENEKDLYPDCYTLHGHKLRLFTLWEAQFVTGALYIIKMPERSGVKIVTNGTR